jgi:hypothetical protein
MQYRTTIVSQNNHTVVIAHQVQINTQTSSTGNKYQLKKKDEMETTYPEQQTLYGK